MQSSQSLVGRKTLRLFAKAKATVQRRPLLSKAAPTAVGFAFGDFLTQYVNRDQSKPYAHDYAKSAAMAAAGAAVAAPAGLALYKVMDAAWPAATLGAAAAKFAADQVLGCAIWQAAYCALPGNEWYREMLGGVFSRAAAAARGGGAALAGGVDARVRRAAAYAAAAASSIVLPLPAAVV